MSPPTSESFYSSGVLRKLTNHTTKEEKERESGRRREGEENSGKLASSLTKTNDIISNRGGKLGLWHLLLCFRDNNQYQNGSSLMSYWFFQIPVNKCLSVHLSWCWNLEKVLGRIWGKETKLWLHVRCTARVSSSPEVTATIRWII